MLLFSPESKDTSGKRVTKESLWGRNPAVSFGFPTTTGERGERKYPWVKVGGRGIIDRRQ